MNKINTESSSKEELEIIVRRKNGEEIFKEEITASIEPEGVYKTKYEKHMAEINRVASALIYKNEQILKEDGRKNPPEKNINVCAKTPSDRLCIPPEGYIRGADYFVDSYKLLEIFNISDKRHFKYNEDDIHVIEHLQMTDWYNYFLNRVDTSEDNCKGISRLVYKYAFINVLSVIEALVQEIAYHSYCYCKSMRDGRECKHLSECVNYLSSAGDKRMPISKILKQIKKNDSIS